MATHPAATTDTVAVPRPGFHIPSRLISVLLVLIGMSITGYMTYTKLVNVPLECSNTGLINCAVVENSAWAYILGIPTSAWGLLAHVMLGSLLILEQTTPFFKRYGVYAMFGVALFASMYHSYLIYISLGVLRALCPWCLAAATTMFIHFIVILVRLRSTLSAPTQQPA